MNNIVAFCIDMVLWNNNGYGLAFDFYKFLSQKQKVTIIIPTNHPYVRERVMHLNTNLTVYLLAIGEMFYHRVFQERRSVNIYDIAMSLHEDECFVKKVKRLVAPQSVIICDSFMWGNFVANVYPDKKFILRSLDVEYDKVIQRFEYKESLTPADLRHKDKVYELEKNAYRSACHSIALMHDEKIRLSELYDVDVDKFSVMPVCLINAGLYKNLLPSRLTSKRVSNIVYIGYLECEAWATVKKIVGIANKLPDVNFHIIGKNVGNEIGNECPSNLCFYGEVSDRKKKEIISNSDGALNLSTQRYGIRTKVLDYMLMGCPIISTEIGMRGYDVKKHEHYVPCDIESMDKTVEYFCGLSAENRNKIAVNAYRFLTQNYDYNTYWNSIFEKIQINDEPKDHLTGVEFSIFGCGHAGKKHMS